MTVPKQEILASIDRELDYYRKRNHWLFQYSIIAVPTVFALAVDKGGLIGNIFIETVGLTAFYIVITVSCFQMQNAMRSRIYMLFRNRERLLASEAAALLLDGAVDAEEPVSTPTHINSFYTTPYKSTDNPSRIFLRVLKAMAVIAIAATWLRFSLGVQSQCSVDNISELAKCAAGLSGY